LHEFCWIGDKGKVNVFWLLFYAFRAVSVHVVCACIAMPECKCKQCGFVRRKMNNASPTRMY
jgi:hypothetical protein